MLFITNPRLRKLEAFMQEVPNFPPKGNKVDLDRLEDEILLFEIESVTFNVKPTNKNSTIRKDNIMKFRKTNRNTALQAGTTGGSITGDQNGTPIEPSLRKIIP